MKLSPTNGRHEPLLSSVNLRGGGDKLQLRDARQAGASSPVLVHLPF
jgi:hypothetical protein